MVSGGSGMAEILRTHRPTRLEWAPEPVSAPSAAREPVVALYCRTSTDGQFEDSIDVQREVLTLRYKALGFEVGRVFVDRGKSGVTVNGRPALRAMLRECEAGRFTVVAVATLCRLARRASVAIRVAERLRAAGVELHDATSGRIDELTLAIAAHCASSERDTLLRRKRDGLLANIRMKLYPGIAPFGYLYVPSTPGLRVPHPILASFVQRAFREAAAGMSPREIAAGFDCPTPDTWFTAETEGWADGWPSWTARMITGLLRNPAYMGTVAYGRTTTLRSERTHRRLGSARVPEGEWHVADVPHMRIVDPETWACVQRRLSEASTRRRAIAPNRGMVMLTSLTACATCGAELRGPYDRDGIAPAYRCTETEECRDGRATIGLVERAVVRSVGEAVRGRRTDAPIDGARRERWRQQFREAGEALSRLYRATADGTGGAPIDEELRRRYESLGRLLRSDGDDTVDADALLGAVDGVAEDPGLEPLSDRGRETFDMVRALLVRVEVGRRGTQTCVRIRMDLGPVATQVAADDLFPLLTTTVDDPQQDPERRAQAAAGADAALVADVMGRGGMVLAASTRSTLDALGPRVLRPGLEELGWTLSDLATACAAWGNTGRRPSPEVDGPRRAETFEQARQLVSTAGLRGEIFAALQEEGARFRKGHARLFSGRNGFTHLDPRIERALTASDIGEFRTADAPGCGTGIRERVADWLERTARSGMASTIAKSDPDLSAALATMRLRGPGVLLREGLLDLAALEGELSAWSSSGQASAVSAAAIILGHLRGASRSDLAAEHETSRGRVDHLVVRYRAVGPWGMAQWGNEGGPGQGRLTRKQLGEVLVAVRENMVGGSSLEQVAEEIVLRHGVHYDLDSLRTVLSRHGLELPTRPEGHLPSLAQARAEAFLRDAASSRDEGGAA